MSTAGPAHRVQSAVVEYGYPNGHLGHLTTEEDAAFKNFKLLCADKGVYKPAEGDTHASHDDATLLRFLRARRFVVQDAYQQFADTEAWRHANQIDELYETIDLDHYDETRRLYPQWTGRRDRRGIPVYVFEVKHLNSKTMAAYEKSAKETHSKAKTDGKTPPKLLRLFALYENLIRFVMPLCSALTDRDHPRTPITQSNNIVDISGVGLKQFWNLRGHMQDASTLATAHYPETLDRIFIIGAPAFFPTVWGWIKKWFDPITTSKIFILGHHDMKKTLESFIDPANIPKKYGGQLEFEFGDMPVLDPHLKSVLEWENGNKDFPHGPLFWINGNGQKELGEVKSEKIRAVAAGTRDGGKERKEEICVVTTLHAEAKANGHAGQTESEKVNEIVPTRPEFLTVPTGLEDETEPPSTGASSVATTEADSEKHAVQDGEVVSVSRPEPVSFVTATEGEHKLDLNEKAGNVPNGSAVANGEAKGPHTTNTANLLDPNLHVGEGEMKTEDATKHVTEKDASESAVGAGAEAADKAHS